ncbi:probable WRKY transcription factor 2 [Ipomoea triloba]|uniref:probable WRKY transcription factor 2 n=1 Tax=Ipomoea triloba TaxID=35885 RepID=UPI00125E18CA|nr:probable WRKY transcription factor 2 [Ipomoea triloba]XP_031116174.1 probable WRKY transcription factor 2 [Ipomoea triloba]XP_031116175.1 probable WRKY transcription factor 2 [Ipomoea triloba]
MAGFGDHMPIMGDWVPPSPSPRAFFSSVLGNDIESRSNASQPLVPDPKEYASSGNSDSKNGAQGSDQTPKLSSLSERNMNSHGGLLERMAARAGFSAPKLKTDSIRPPALVQNQELRSPYVTIPPGLSPTTLLDSPVFLSNSLVQSSPTTGKFAFPSIGDSRNSALFMGASDNNKETSFNNNDASSFAFKPVIETGPSLFPETISKVPPSSLSWQSVPGIEVSVHSENALVHQCAEPTLVHTQSGTLEQSVFSRSYTEGVSNIISEPRTFQAVAGSMEHSPPPDEQQDEDIDQRGGGDPNVLGAPADDGYNWRKYGQKQVKGSEYPRSYYKCTHPNCPVKKKVERSHEGHITEIIYKGTHNHQKPPPNRRAAFGSENAEQDGTIVIGDPIWENVQNGSGAGGPDWGNDNLEVTSSGTQFEPRDPVEGSSPFSNDEDEDDRGTHGSVSLPEGEGDDTDSKRRKIETYAADMSGATRAIREPRVVVQTTSEVDILDDGYRWRKYGQKVVKGNPNPRSYYKCTSAGCTVRKHVERASHDLKSVITTYEGKHNHDVPAARNSSHPNSGASNGLSSQTTATQGHVHRPEPSQLQNTMSQFARPPSLASFGFPGGPQLGHTLGFGFGMNQQGLANLAMAGLGPNQGKFPVPPVHSYLGQQHPMNDMRPKAEPKMEPSSDPGLNLSNDSSVYQQFTSRLPLGPQM